MYSPTREEFLRLSSQGNCIPVFRRLLADFETPLSAYRKLSGAAESFLFESVEGGEHLGRYSFVGCNPRLVVKQVGDRVDVVQDGRVRESFAIKPRGTPLDDRTVYDGLAVVERILAQYRPV